jgi:hypothetical protein
VNTFRSRHVRRVLVPMMAVSLLSACGKWTYQAMAPSRAVIEKEPSQVRLTMLNGDRMELGHPIVSGGEIIGHPVHGPNGPEHYTLRAATDSVAEIEIRNLDVLATTIVVVLGTAAAIPVAAIISVSTSDGPLWPQ